MAKYVPHIINVPTYAKQSNEKTKKKNVESTYKMMNRWKLVCALWQ